MIRVVTGGLLTMMSELRQGEFNGVEPRFLSEDWRMTKCAF